MDSAAKSRRFDRLGPGGQAGGSSRIENFIGFPAGLSGADLARLLLKIRPELPVILATGYSTTINPEKAKAIGIRELLLKPNTTQSLSAAIRRAH
jgi:DNA-binding NarL/FixJ family response regulator